jgi:prepilin-type N-terminal cleavage/methylation domain-containing protein
VRRRKQAGFTLIELLVVIAIIAILAAILFPVFARARAKAKQSACLSNMKQMALGWMQYTQDYDETTPIYHYYYADAGGTQYNMQQEGMMYPYVKNGEIFGCPDFPTRSNPCNVVSLYGFNYGGYCYNMQILAYYPNAAYTAIARAKTIGTIEDSAGTFLWADSCCHYGGATDEGACPRIDLSNAKRHAEGINAAIADGHGKWYKNITMANWTPELD